MGTNVFNYSGSLFFIYYCYIPSFYLLYFLISHLIFFLFVISQFVFSKISSTLTAIFFFV